MPAIRLLNWNIQNYGRTKSGLNYNNYDVVAAIARRVVAAAADIFVLLEVNTTSDATARELADIMLAALRHNDVAGRWRVGVLSPNTGREFYAFFIRNPALIQPLPLIGPIIPQYGTPAEVLGQMRPIANAEFGEVAGDGILDWWFPLIAPDVHEVTRYGRQLNIPAWPGIRRPVLALFRILGANGAYSILPIVACHFAPAATVASQQFRTLGFFSFLNGLSPHPTVAPVALNLRIGGVLGQHAPRYYALTGDFNIDYPNDHYYPIVGRDRYELGATAYITPNTVLPRTFLMAYRQFVAERPHQTELFAIRNYDNWFVRRSAAYAAAVAPGANHVYNIPESVRLRQLELLASVAHYRELDQRGFSSGEYPTLARDYAGQLTNRTRIVNYTSALVGARLISDHLPSLLEITVN